MSLTYQTRVLALAAATLVGCAMPGAGDPVDVDGELPAGKADQRFQVHLSEDDTRVGYRIPCPSDVGCRLELRMVSDRTDWLREQPWGVTVDLATVTVTGPDMEPMLETMFQEHRSETGGLGFVNWKHELIVPPGDSRLVFDLAAEASEASIGLSTFVGPIANAEHRAVCDDACALMDLEGCTPPELNAACHEGCGIITDYEATEFAQCVADSRSCDTFCFYAMPGVVRFSGGCEPSPGETEDRCNDDFVCVAGVCIPPT